MDAVLPIITLVIGTVLGMAATMYTEGRREKRQARAAARVIYLELIHLAATAALIERALNEAARGQPRLTDLPSDPGPKRAWEAHAATVLGIANEDTITILSGIFNYFHPLLAEYLHLLTRDDPTGYRMVDADQLLAAANNIQLGLRELARIAGLPPP